jgi:hypothetical protein
MDLSPDFKPKILKKELTSQSNLSKKKVIVTKLAHHTEDALSFYKTRTAW